MHNPKRFSLASASIVDEACDLLEQGFGYSVMGGLDSQGYETSPIGDLVVAWDGIGALYRASYMLREVFPYMGRLHDAIALVDAGTQSTYGRSKFGTTFHYMMSQGEAPLIIAAMRTWAQEVFDAWT